MSTVFGLSPTYSYSLFAAVLYCILPLISSIILSIVAEVPFLGLFSFQFSLQSFLITVLSIAAAMSLVSVFIVISLKLSPRLDIAGEMARIKWIEGIFQTPPKIAWLLPLFSASFEEIFFRGVLLQGLVGNGMSIALSVGVVTFAFILNQVLLTDTWIQGIVLGYSSLAISVVGSIAYLASGSLIPSMIMHASFAGFYTNRTNF